MVDEDIPPPPGRRALRRQANIDALIAAAHRLIAEQGEDFTTQDLIAEADVALQTFYRSFKGKDELFIAVIGDLITAHCDSLAKRAAALDGPVERLRFYVTDTVTAMVADPGNASPRFITTQHWRLQIEHAEALAEAVRPFAELIRVELEQGRDAGVLECDDPEADAWVMSRLVMSAVHHHAFAGEATDAEAVARRIWRFCSGAVRGSS